MSFDLYQEGGTLNAQRSDGDTAGLLASDLNIDLVVGEEATGSLYNENRLVALTTTR